MSPNAVYQCSVLYKLDTRETLANCGLRPRPTAEGGGRSYLLLAVYMRARVCVVIRDVVRLERALQDDVLQPRLIDVAFGAYAAQR